MEKHAERLPDYESAYAELIRRGPDELYTLPDHIGAADFLRWVSNTKDVLLHGSNNPNITELEPRQANCKSKEFGNQLGVYAVHDPVLPLFYAIKDKEKFRGIAQSGYTDQDDQEREYHFRISSELMKSHPWSEGAVYVLPKSSFAQGHDDDGQPINEWLSTEPVAPLAKIRVAPKDFPYLDDIQALDDHMSLIGSGYFYNAYDSGDGCVLKKQKSLWQTLRNHKLKNLPLVFRQNTLAKKNTGQVKDRLDENLGRLLGNPRFGRRYSYTQDKVQLLMDYFDQHSLDENKAAIDAYVELTLNLLDYGIHDYVYKFKNSYGFTSSGDLVCIDFNEVTFSKAETLDYVARRHWLTEAQYRKFPEGPLKQYFKDAMEARLTVEMVDARFGSLFDQN